MRLDCGNSDRFEQTDRFRIRYTGAEANAAIAMSWLGAENVHLLSAVPDNRSVKTAFGNSANLARMPPMCSARAEGRLGLFFLETGASLRPSRIIYDRAGSTFAGRRTKRTISPESSGAIPRRAGCISPARSRR